MLEMAKKTILFGIGALSFTKEKGEKLVKELVEKGKLSQEEALNLVNDIFRKGEEERKILAQVIKQEMAKIQENLGLATKEDLLILERRLQELEEKIKS